MLQTVEQQLPSWELPSWVSEHDTTALSEALEIEITFRGGTGNYNHIFKLTTQAVKVAVVLNLKKNVLIIDI